MYNPGDRVKFLNEVGGGVITKISGTVIYVENEDGFELPVSAAEIIPAVPVVAPKAPSAPAPENDILLSKGTPASVVATGSDAPRMYMALLPENTQNPPDGNIRLFIVNACNCCALYLYSHFDGKRYVTKATGKMEPNTKLQLETLASKELNSLPRFCFSVLSYCTESPTPAQYITKTIDINPVRFYKTAGFISSEFFGQPVMLLPITCADTPQLTELLSHDFHASPPVGVPLQSAKPILPSEEDIEVDLHIDALVDTTNGLTNKDMLDFQMNRFRHELEKAIKNRARRIVFIHGVGNGILKQEIRRELVRKYPRYTVQDASFREYGYGATMVILQNSRRK